MWGCSALEHVICILKGHRHIAIIRDAMFGKPLVVLDKMKEFYYIGVEFKSKR